MDASLIVVVATQSQRDGRHLGLSAEHRIEILEKDVAEEEYVALELNLIIDRVDAESTVVRQETEFLREIRAVHQVRLRRDLKIVTLDDEGDVRNATVVELAVAISLPESTQFVLCKSTRDLLLPFANDGFVELFRQMDQSCSGVHDPKSCCSTHELRNVDSAVGEALDVWGPVERGLRR